MKYFFAFLALAVCLASAEECAFTSCDKECRKFGWYGYRCEDNACTCMNTSSSTQMTEFKTLKSIQEGTTDPECTFTSCERECRKVGWYGYRCENNECTCMDTSSITRITEFKSLKSIKKGTADSVCTLTICDRECKKVGWYGYRCEDDGCNCMNTSSITRITEFKSLKGIKEGTTDPECTFTSCDRECRKVGWYGYRCEDNECICMDTSSVTRITQDKSLKSIKEGTTDSECTFTSCDKECRKFGWYGYRCEDNGCTCMNTISSTQITEFKTLKSIQEGTTDPECTFTSCERECRKVGWYGYRCEDNECICMDTSSITRITEFKSLRSIKKETADSVCTLTICDRECKKVGWYGYRCENNECTCMDTSSVNRITEFKSLKSIKEGTTDFVCTLTICDRECRKVGSYGYRCEDDGCTCMNTSSSTQITTFTALKSIKEVTTDPECTFTSCDRECRKVGWYGYRCEDNECTCMNTSSSTRITEVKSLKSIKEVTNDPGCGSVSCGLKCIKLGSFYSKCVDNKCLCKPPRN